MIRLSNPHISNASIEIWDLKVVKSFMPLGSDCEDTPSRGNDGGGGGGGGSRSESLPFDSQRKTKQFKVLEFTGVLWSFE